MSHKTVTILLRIRVRGHFVMSITKYRESHSVGVLDNPLCQTSLKNAGCSVNGDTGGYGNIGCNTIEVERQTEGHRCQHFCCTDPKVCIVRILRNTLETLGGKERVRKGVSWLPQITCCSPESMKKPDSIT